MMEQFQFTGDTPALYYAQAAWEFKHNNTPKANDWIVSARKIYSPALNFVFAESFYDLGWLQNQATVPVASTEVAKVEPPPPSVEPDPITSAVVAANQPAKQPAEIVAKNDKAAADPASSPKVEMPVVSNALPAETRAPLPREPEEIPAKDSAPAAATTQQAPANEITAPVASTPATVLAPATVQQWSQPTASEQLDRWTNSQTLLFGGLLLGGFAILGWVVYSEVRRRVSVSMYRSPAPAMGPRFDAVEPETKAAKIAPPSRLAGGPPQVSLQLKASEPSVRRAAVPFGKVSRPFGSGATAPAGNGTVVENFVPREVAPVQKPEPDRHTGASAHHRDRARAFRGCGDATCGRLYARPFSPKSRSWPPLLNGNLLPSKPKPPPVLKTCALRRQKRPWLPRSPAQFEAPARI